MVINYFYKPAYMMFIKVLSPTEFEYIMLNYHEKTQSFSFEKGKKISSEDNMNEFLRDAYKAEAEQYEILEKIMEEEPIPTKKH